MVLIWALPFDKGIDFVISFLIAKDAWVDFHTPITCNHSVAHHQEKKKSICWEKKLKTMYFNPKEEVAKQPK